MVHPSQSLFELVETLSPTSAQPPPQVGLVLLTLLTALLVQAPMPGTHAKHGWLGAEDWLA